MSLANLRILEPFLFFFQDPSTVFASHLIFTHNAIHWYLLLILSFAYYSMFSIIRDYSWTIANKARGFGRRTSFSGEAPLFPSLEIFVLIAFDAFHLTAAFYINQSHRWLLVYMTLTQCYTNSFLEYYFPLQFDALEEEFFKKELGEEEEDADFFSEENLLTHRLAVASSELKRPRLVSYLEYVLSLEATVLSLLATASMPELVEEDPSLPTLFLLARNWVTQQKVDLYLQSYLTRRYTKSYVDNHRSFLLVQKGNDSRRFEYTCVFVPTTIVLAILAHSLGLLYSGTEEISPGMYFTAIGHQWFWSYELEAIIEGIQEEKVPTTSLKASFESIPLIESALSFGAKRLLEVDSALVLPVGVPIRALATSGDVLHSWAVPEMGIKIDAVPGRINDSLAFIYRPGIFYGQCSELCGVGHGFMPIVVEAVDVASFIHWGQALE